MLVSDLILFQMMVINDGTILYRIKIAPKRIQTSTTHGTSSKSNGYGANPMLERAVCS